MSMMLYVADGRQGTISTKTLPAGDIELSAHGDEWFSTFAEKVAEKTGATWNAKKGCWIVPKDQGLHLVSELFGPLRCK